METDGSGSQQKVPMFQIRAENDDVDFLFICSVVVCNYVIKIVKLLNKVFVSFFYLLYIIIEYL